MKGHAQRWILCALLPLFAAGAEPPPPPTFQTLRANENYDHLRPVEPLLAWQRAKMIGLTTDRLTYLSVGADLRMRAERTRHPAFGDSPTDNVLLTARRLRSQTDTLHLQARTEVFAQAIRYERAIGQTFIPYPFSASTAP
ncbi:MAG: hypothetical protein JJT96_07800 [Opitutales bacterium]|nr:hypothetical protein [Opitutales bacterium]